jgi:hypothetical protein
MRSLVALVLALVPFTFIGCGEGVEGDPSGHGEGAVKPEYELNPAAGPEMGHHLTRGEHAAHQRGGGGGGSPNMLWHNGAIMNSAEVTAIFWGQSWANASFVGDKMDGIDSFYSGIGGSSYMGTNIEYTGTNGQVGKTVNYHGHVVDTSSAPGSAPTTTQIQNEVCKAIANPVANGYYPVYTDTRRGRAGYCAWHSYGTCNGVPVQFGFFFNTDGDAGCDPQDTSGLHSQGLSSLVNISGHELSETVTDPRNGGWFDSSGGENGDKCAWTFGAPLLTFSNGSKWKVQGNWSNAAYNARSGYNGAGCIDGH